MLSKADIHTKLQCRQSDKTVEQAEQFSAAGPTGNRLGHESMLPSGPEGDFMTPAVPLPGMQQGSSHACSERGECKTVTAKH